MVTGRVVRRARVGRLDAQIGGRIRMRRVELGMTEVSLATSLGMVPEIVQQIETSQRRATASQLSAIAAVLGVPVSYFFLDKAPLSVWDGLNRVQQRPVAAHAAPSSGGAGQLVFHELLAALDVAADPAQRHWIAQLLERAGAPADLVERARKPVARAAGT